MNIHGTQLRFCWAQRRVVAFYFSIDIRTTKVALLGGGGGCGIEQRQPSRVSPSCPGLESQLCQDFSFCQFSFSRWDPSSANARDFVNLVSGRPQLSTRKMSPYLWVTASYRSHFNGEALRLRRGSNMRSSNIMRQWGSGVEVWLRWRLSILRLASVPSCQSQGLSSPSSVALVGHHISGAWFVPAIRKIVVPVVCSASSSPKGQRFNSCSFKKIKQNLPFLKFFIMKKMED